MSNTIEQNPVAPVVIDVQDIHKKFRVYFDKGNTLKEKILFSKRRAYEDRWVLRGISFQVHKGEAIGLIGHNGCGKSTTLKLLTRIMYPDEGKITMTGRVSSLIELGAGFHPDMSGRENIYINASIFGLTRQEIDRRLDDIIAFSELEEFIDNPVRTYSSGMYMRLAFAVAINVDADILLIDEILAVGDAAFQAKCFAKLQEIKARGTTIVIVSHALGQIEQICERSIWIDKGKIRMEGAPREVHPYYMEFMSGNSLSPKMTAQKSEETQPEKLPETVQPAEKPENTAEGQETVAENDKKVADPAMQNKTACITHAEIQNADGQTAETFKTGETLRLAIEYRAKEKISPCAINVGIYRLDGVLICSISTMGDHIPDITLHTKGSAVFEIPDLQLLPGDYRLELALTDCNGLPYDTMREGLNFRMVSPYEETGVVHIPHTWKLV